MVARSGPWPFCGPMLAAARYVQSDDMLRAVGVVELPSRNAVREGSRLFVPMNGVVHAQSANCPKLRGKSRVRRPEGATSEMSILWTWRTMHFCVSEEARIDRRAGRALLCFVRKISHGIWDLGGGHILDHS